MDQAIMGRGGGLAVWLASLLRFWTVEAFREYGAAHELDDGQVYWAWRKNGELSQAAGADPDEPCWLYRQEYPATSTEAFQAGGHESYIPGELVLKARGWVAPDQMHQPLILGVDIARGGRDKTRIVDRRGRCAGHASDLTIDSADLMDVTGRVGKEIDRLEPDAVFVDVTGLGAGVYDRLRERGYREVHAVNFGSKARDADRYANKRAEIWRFESLAILGKIKSILIPIVAINHIQPTNNVRMKHLDEIFFHI